MPHIELFYGERKLKFELPERNLVAILSPKDAPGTKDELAEVRRAVQHPIAGKRISEVAGPEKKVAIVIDDITRPTPVHVSATVVYEELKNAGVEDRNISVVAAIGTHRPNTAEEMRKRVGDEVFEHVKVLNHDPDDKNKLVFLGVSSRGTPIWINKTVAEADVRIGIGSINQHMLAGYGGGAKLILPGVSGRESISHNHLMGMGHPKCRIGVVDNPVRADMEEIARMLKVDMIINTVLNSKGEIVKAFAGDVVEVHREGVKRYNKFGVKAPRLVDVAIASSHPKNITFGQGLWALYSADMVTRKGGTIVYAVPAPEGISHAKGFVEDLKKYVRLRMEPNEIKAMALKGEVADMANASALYDLAMMEKTKNIVLMSDGISEKEASEIGIRHYVKSIDEALKIAMDLHGKDAEFAVLPYGSITLVLSHDG